MTKTIVKSGLISTKMILITDGQPNKQKGLNTYETPLEKFIFNVHNLVANLTGIVIDTIGIGDDCDIAFLETISVHVKNKIS